MPRDKQLTPGQAADTIGIAVRTLEYHLKSENPPPFTRTPGGHRRYSRKALLAWRDARVQAEADRHPKDPATGKFLPKPT